MITALFTLVALLLVAWLTAAATAVRSVSRIWLRHWVERQLAGAGTIEAYLARPHRLVLSAGAGVAVLVTLAGTTLGAQPHAAGWSLALEGIALAIALLVLGQLVPRAIARRFAPALIPVLLPPLHAAAWILAPLMRATRAVGRAIRPRHRARPASPREGLADLLREGELEGIGEPDEIDIITGVVQFGEKVLRDVMTPRTEVFAVDATMAPADMARSVAQSGYSRVPVYRDSLDEVIGIVHVLDLLTTAGDRWPPLGQVSHAPATKRCSEMLFDMLRGQRHMVVVLDEFGGTAGVATLEDVLEELVGEIRDEHDEPAPPELPVAPNALVLDASTPLDAVGRQLNVELVSGEHDPAQSIGGLLVHRLGRIPVMGERFRFGELEVTVIDAEPARVRRLLVQRAQDSRVLELKFTR